MTLSSGKCTEVNPAFSAYPDSSSAIRPDMLFREAGEVYIRSRMLLGAESMARDPHYVRPTTLYNYRQNVKSLGLFSAGCVCLTFALIIFGNTSGFG
jgi:hypothetical protein